jgi:Putative regulatory, ligand-binding protein related to C-terminal domains of K+ channels
MGKFKEADLAGIGKKYTFSLNSGDEIVVVVHATGRREIHIMDKMRDEPAFTVVLSDEEAKQIAFVIGGVDFQPVPTEKIDFIAKGVALEWIRVKHGSPLAGKTIGENQIRKKTGVTVVAILRGENIIASPGPEEIIHENDSLLIVGKIESIKKFP